MKHLLLCGALLASATTALAGDVVEMSTKPLSISPGGQVGNRVRIRWSVQKEAPVLVQVCTAAGQPLRTLDAGVMPRGEYSAIFDGKDGAGKLLPAGEYILRAAVSPKVEADLTFGAGGMLGSVSRKFKFTGDRKLDIGVKGFDVRTVTVNVDGEKWEREEDFGLAGDNFVADPAKGIIEFNPEASLNKNAEIAVTVASGLPLENPWAIATAPDGSLYVGDNLYRLDAANKRATLRTGFVYKTDASGKPIREFGKSGVLDTGVAALATDAEGMLYVAPGEHQVDVYDAHGTAKYSIAGWLDSNRPQPHQVEGGYSIVSIAVNEARQIMITNISRMHVLYDATKPGFEGYLGCQDEKHGAEIPPVIWQEYGPCSAAVDNCFYQTTYAHAINKSQFDPTTRTLSLVWNTPPGNPIEGTPTGPAELWCAMGIAVDHSGLLYVADRMNHRIQIFFDAGAACKHVASVGSNGTDVAQCQMTAPHAVALSPDGKALYVADDGFFFTYGKTPAVHGLARVTRMKLGFEDVVEAKLTVK